MHSRKYTTHIIWWKTGCTDMCGSYELIILAEVIIFTSVLPVVKWEIYRTRRHAVSFMPRQFYPHAAFLSYMAKQSVNIISSLATDQGRKQGESDRERKIYYKNIMSQATLLANERLW